MTSRNDAHPEIGILALVGHRWLPQWQVPHQVLSRLSRRFHVVWVNPAHEWRRILHEAKRMIASTNGHPAPTGMDVYTPGPFVPLVHRPSWLASGLFRARLWSARRRLTRRGCKTVILSVWRPVYGDALRLTRYDLSCYYIDDEFTFSSVEKPVSDEETTILRSVDQVFIASPQMLRKKGSLNRNTAWSPNGVAYAEFATPCPEPTDIASIRRPRLGYSGYIKKQVDWSLLLSLATRHPDWQFVFVGKQSGHPEIAETLTRLSKLDNVHFLGSKSIAEMAKYPQHFDVCLMPYCVDDYTKYIDPLKLHEYLASGQPVVGSNIPALDKFRGVVAVATSVDEWSSAISKALEASERTPERRKVRQTTAREYDWDVLVGKIASTLLERLEEKGRDS
ncbi:MAG TPA: glycosyltransferase [Candidatus Polarisedimenticolia bacterium]|nr:glycosyltransferase [Candidatus Polarisedimenticolia bacterium]